MNKYKELKAIFLIGLIMMVITWVIYFLGFIGRTNIFIAILSYFFVIISEISLLVTIVKNKKGLYGISIITISSLYMIFTMVAAFLFVKISIMPVGIYILINVIAIGVTAIINIVLNYFQYHQDVVNKEILNAEAIMIQCQSIIETYLNSDEYDDYKKQLNKIYEDIKYSDISSECGLESTLLEKIENISENKEDLSNYLREISSLVKERNIKMKNLKRGTI